MGFMVLCSTAATSMALMISALARTTDLSVAILPMALEVSRLYGAFFLSPANLPSYFSWLDAMSYVKYAYIGVSLNEFDGLQLTCDKPPCAINTGEDSIALLKLDKDLTIASCVGGLLLFIFFSRSIAYMGVRYLKG